MRITNSLPLVALALCAGLSAQDAAQDTGKVPGHDAGALRAEAAKIFAKRCTSCHLPPDPSFAVDRAWITQLTDTA